MLGKPLRCMTYTVLNQQLYTRHESAELAVSTGVYHSRSCGLLHNLTRLSVLHVVNTACGG